MPSNPERAARGDMRAASPSERRTRRQQVVTLRAAGTSLTAIALQTGLSRTGVFDICRRFATWGMAALDDAPSRGRRGLLDDAQDADIRALLVAHLPDQLSLRASLWTPAAVASLVEQRTGVRLSVRNTALKLKRWGFGPPAPLAKARERCAATAGRWYADRYPAIAARARVEGADLVWADVSPLRQAPGAAGHAPAVFSTVDSRGRMRWAVSAGALHPAAFIELLARCTRGATRKIVLILDPLAVRGSAPVLRWLAEHEDSVEIVDLPGVRRSRASR